MTLSNPNGRRSSIVLCLLWALGSTPQQSLATPDAQAMLAASDAIRNPNQPFRVRLNTP